MRRQVYEWRNIMPVGEDNILNTLPILKPNNVHTIALGANIPIDIFIGGVGNNIDMLILLNIFKIPIGLQTKVLRVKWFHSQMVMAG